MSTNTATLSASDTRSEKTVSSAREPKIAAGSNSSQPPAKRRRSPVRTALLVGLVAAVAAWGIHLALHAYRYESTDNAYVVGHIHQISAQESGQIQSVRVEENQLVKAGEVLAELDPQEFTIAVEKARAAIAQAEAQKASSAAAISEARAGLEEAKARAAQAGSEVTQIAAQLELARINFSRNEQLFANNNGAATRADIDNARATRDATEASLAAAKANQAAEASVIDSALASQEAARAQADAARANAAAAQAQLQEAQRQLAHTKILAPADGRIGAKAVEPGNHVVAGQTLFALATPDAWVVANFKETQLARMHVGQKVDLAIDALPEEELTGHIESLSPASGAQFALLPPDNATGNFNKVVQRVPVKILFDGDALTRLGDRVRLGFSVVVEVRIR